MAQGLTVGWICLLPVLLASVAESQCVEDEIGELLAKAETAMDAEAYEEAVEYFEDVTELAPNESTYMHSLGVAHGRLAREVSVFSAIKHARASMKCFERAIELDPQSGHAVFTLFSFHLSAPRVIGGRISVAKSLAKRLHALDPELARQADVILAERQ